jgi:hypothetical protein
MTSPNDLRNALEDDQNRDVGHRFGGGSQHMNLSFCRTSGATSPASQHRGSSIQALLTSGDTASADISAALYGVVMR